MLTHVRKHSRLVMLVCLTLAACQTAARKLPPPVQQTYVNPHGVTLQDRFVLPAGYTRVPLTSNSFGAYLRQIPLKPDGAQVHYYNGRIKANTGVYVAVVDMPIGNKNLQQCADVIMHVRARYLYTHGMEDKIHFTLTNGFRADYSKWMQGYRIVLSGNKASWVKKAAPGNSPGSFDEYMDVIYNYCGTLSLSRELKKADYGQLQPGDVLIKGGSPGHAELVMDVATNKEGKKIYLLAQSYMPAQEMQILDNPAANHMGPWYEAHPPGGNIITPEWNFTPDQLMRFPD